MSVNIDYFFNFDGSLLELGNLLDGVLGCCFEPYEGDPSDLFCRLLSLETSLSEHAFDDDRELNFSAYRYQFGTRTAAGVADLREIQLGLMTFLPFVLYRRASISGGMLVYDIQQLLARYEVRDGRFYDTVTGQPVNFPAHLQRVCAQIQVA
jgi:hypothetical protein